MQALAIGGGDKAWTCGEQDLELMTRYSNTPALLDDLRNVREPVLDPGGEDQPELGGEHWANGRGWALAHRLTPSDRQAVVDGYQAGATAREPAERFSISQSSVKRILRWAERRKRGKLPS